MLLALLWLGAVGMWLFAFLGAAFRGSMHGAEHAVWPVGLTSIFVACGIYTLVLVFWSVRSANKKTKDEGDAVTSGIRLWEFCLLVVALAICFAYPGVVDKPQRLRDALGPELLALAESRGTDSGKPVRIDDRLALALEEKLNSSGLVWPTDYELRAESQKAKMKEGWQAWLDAGGELWKEEVWWEDPRFSGLSVYFAQVVERTPPKFLTGEAVSGPMLEAHLRQLHDPNREVFHSYNLFFSQANEYKPAPDELKAWLPLLEQLTLLSAQNLLGEEDVEESFGEDARSILRSAEIGESWEFQTSLARKLQKQWRTYQENRDIFHRKYLPRKAAEMVGSLENEFLEEKRTRQFWVSELLMVQIKYEILQQLDETGKPPANLGELGLSEELSPLVEWLDYKVGAEGAEITLFRAGDEATILEPLTLKIEF